MDVDDVAEEHQHVQLLLRTEGEEISAEQHLEDVDGAPHPLSVVGVAQPLCHFQNGQVTDEELKSSQKFMLNSFTSEYFYATISEARILICTKWLYSCMLILCSISKNSKSCRTKLLHYKKLHIGNLIHPLDVSVKKDQINFKCSLVVFHSA